MEQVINFNKNFNEYLLVFGGDDSIPASEVQKQWSVYLDLVIDHSNWHALWKIPRFLCEKYEIPYPTTVLVFTKEVNFSHFRAAIKIVAVQEEVDLPPDHVVDLRDLWLIKEQDSSVDSVATANALDMLRFFYKNLWMPWDLNQEDCSDWVSAHLESRLRLYYDMKSEKMPWNILRKYRALLRDSAMLQRPNFDFFEDDPQEQGADLKIKMAMMKTEMDLLENSMTLAYLVRKEKKEKEGPSSWLVLRGGAKLSAYEGFLRKIEALYPGKEFKTATLLQNALDSAAPNDVILLLEGGHQISSVAALEAGGTLKSLTSEIEKTVITNTNEEAMLDFFNGDVFLENLSLNAGNSRGLVSRSGKVTLKNCHLFSRVGTKQEGIVAVPGAKIILENCILSGFTIGIYAYSRSSVTLRSCTLRDLKIAVKNFENSTVHLDNCIFENCEEKCVYVDSL